MTFHCILLNCVIIAGLALLMYFYPIPKIPTDFDEHWP